MCVANAARSQLAEGLARSLAPADVAIYSAGSHPASLSSRAVQVMREIGIDIRDQYAKSVAEIPLEEIDTIITLCAEEVCPTLAIEVRRLHWPFPDPVLAAAPGADPLEGFRRLRDGIRERLEGFFS